jgi:hypothetical protein
MIYQSRLLFLTLFLLWASSSQAQVLWTEDFEGTNASIKASFIDTSCLNGANQSTFPEASNPGISTARAHSGSRSIRYHYGGHQYPLHLGLRQSEFGLAEWPSYGGCNAGRSFTPQPEIWVSWYEFYETGFVIDEIGTKGLQIQMTGNGGYFWLMDGIGGANGTGLVRQAHAVPNAWIPSVGRYDNRVIFTSTNTPVNRWVYSEVRIKLSTNNQPNGIIEWYEDGRLVGSAYDIQFAGFVGGGSLGPLSSDTKLSGIGLYVQDGMGDLYRDDLTVSTTRLDGTGNTQPPTPRPASPKNLTVN